jgi:acetyl esterase/lipase
MPSAEHDAMVEQIVASGRRTPESAPDASVLEETRAAEVSSAAPILDDLSVRDTRVGDVPCLVVTPLGVEPVGTVVFAHGGGYIWMRAATHLTVVAEIVRASGCRGVNVDYRRAPEHPYPAAVDDLVAVHRGLLAEGVASSRIVFAGESAGGGLAVAGLVALRDDGVPLPAAVVAISPWTDLAVTGRSADTADDPIVSGRALRMMADLYLAGADPRSPTASPLYADLRGLPPLLVQVGTRESLLDDARRLAERALAHGVDVTLHEFDGVVHMWVVTGPRIPEAQAAFAEIGDFVREHLG